jgi:hypothetical protein
MLGKRKVAISVESEPSGTAFEVTEIELTKTASGNVTQAKLNTAAIGPVRFANNGKIELQFPTTFDLDENASYKVTVNTKLIGINENVNSAPTDLILVDATTLIVLNRPTDYSLTINNDDIIFDSNINTEGKGDLGIEFATKEYADKIRTHPLLFNVYTCQSFIIPARSNSTSPVYSHPAL